MTSKTSSSSHISLKPRSKKKTAYKVFFNQWSGKIIQVVSEKSKVEFDDEDIDYFVTDTNLARGIASGKQNQKTLRVGYDDNGHYEIVDTKQFTISKKKENQMSEIEFSDEVIENWDLLIKFHYLSNQVVFRYHHDSHSRTAPRNINNEEYLDFYITVRNNPDALLDKIQIPIDALLNEPFVAVDISDLVRYTSIDNISLLTRRIAKRYCAIVSGEEFDFEKATYEKLHNDSPAYLQPRVDPDLQLEFDSQRNTLTVHRPENFDYVRRRLLKPNSLEIFAIGDSIDHLCDQISIDFRGFEQSDSVTVTLASQPRQFVTNNQALNISLVETKS